MFHKIFEMLAQASRKPIRFPYFDGSETGIRAITADMCMKQGPGLGDYLHDKYKAYTWDEHLQHILVFCQVHVKRNFRKKFGDHDAKEAVNRLWDQTSVEELFKIVKGIQATFGDAKLDQWLKTKVSKPWILAGLCSAQSKMDYRYWKAVAKHTNISESSHFQDNYGTGRGLSLLGAILR
jgi:hypothetical protein